MRVLFSVNRTTFLCIQLEDFKQIIVTVTKETCILYYLLTFMLIKKPWCIFTLLDNQYIHYFFLFLLQNTFQNYFIYSTYNVLFQKISIPLPWKVFLAWTSTPSGISILVPYFPLKNWALETLLPLGISGNLPWGGFGYFLELQNTINYWQYFNLLLRLFTMLDVKNSNYFFILRWKLLSLCNLLVQWF